MGETVRLKAGESVPAYRTGLVAVLDIGSTKTVCLIARCEPGSIKVLGAALRESRGLRSGTVMEMTAAEESIRDCVAAAENLADARLQNVLISVNCGSPTTVTSRTAIPLPEGVAVNDEVLRHLLSEGRARCQLEGHVVIQSMPTSYVVDDSFGVRDPSGMVGQRIGVTMHGVAVKPTPLSNLRLAVERGHLKVAASLFAPYASGLSVLTDDEKQLGATIIDMGGGCTSIAVFMEGHLVHADMVPIGGQAVTNDIAVMLAAPLAAAERAKVLYGAALGDLESGADVVSIPQMGEENEEGDLRVPRSMLTRIIQARLEETFSEVHKRLRESGFDVAAGRRLVLTGGASQLAGARELAGRVLNKQVRVGRPRPQAGLPASSAGPDYATAVGLLMAGATMPPEVLNPELQSQQAENGTKGWLSRLTGGLIG
ncbi:cell division protein FtsA [Rhizomicrobium palustre]|uniref:Cell division protein FtsA n=1 Tax=Rhizomicrobium palustre TaxID=189966 RepID=A0A846MVU4_9PROT|nr:cell division protein FtsA [Rhizomicrobium palustre]NIK87496.1 cell division protein FtsA [Rhizomicrobium palustre]